jgi:ferredoxin
MKCIVIYFSQTGNTEKIAKRVHAGVIQANGNCDLVKIKDANPRHLYEYDLIGLGSPTFDVLNVWDFIKNMWSVGGKHAFAFHTHGGNPGVVPFNLYQRLKRRGLVVIGVQDWYGDCTLLHHLDPYPTKGHPDEIDLREAEDFGREMVERSRRISAGETELIPPAPKRGSRPAVKFLTGEDLPPASGSDYASMLKYHAEKCQYPKCRLCMDNCPVYGIDLSIKPPVIAKPCEACEFCAKICPTGAIDIYDWVEAMAKPTIKKLYPLFLLPELEKAEASGKFRRLLPKENIVLRLDNFGYRVHKNHPQWIIGKGPR